MAAASTIRSKLVPIVPRDDEGNELVQRPISLDLEPESAPAQAPDAGKRVKVYHKRNTTCWLSDGTVLKPNAEAYILEADVEVLKEHVLRLAE